MSGFRKPIATRVLVSSALLLFGCSDDGGSSQLAGCPDEPAPVVRPPPVAQPASDPAQAEEPAVESLASISLTFFEPLSVAPLSIRPVLQTALPVRSIDWLSRSESPYQVVVGAAAGEQNELSISWVVEFDGVDIVVAIGRQQFTPTFGGEEQLLQLFPSDFDLQIDDDGDGVTNLDEIRAGTDPLRRIVRSGTGNGSIRLQHPG